MNRVGYYFTHPQPLAPTTKAEPKKVGNKVKWVEEGKGVRRGVGTTQSIYYLWFEYSKRSNKYKRACANNRKGMKKLYEGFGDISKFKTDDNGNTEAEDFYRKWWERAIKEQDFFGIRAIP